MSLIDLKNTFSGEKMDFCERLKTIGGTAVNVGVDLIVGTALTAYLNPKKGIKRALGGLGILVLSMKVGDVAEEYFGELVDDLKEAFSKAKTEAEEAAKELKKETEATEEKSE